MSAPDMFSLAAIGERIRTQDNRATALPIYVVQRFVPLRGDDEDAEDCDCPGVDERPDHEKWEFVMPFFTELAADRYIAGNKHRLGEARVFVESGYRNPEWEAIRLFLASLPAPESGGP